MQTLYLIILTMVCGLLAKKDKIYYFSYGSNINEERLHLNVPSAVFYNIGYIDNYRLDFTGISQKWNGSVATIVPQNNSVVWGVIWRINRRDVNKLDKQEGISKGIYFPKQVGVKIFNRETFKGKRLFCRTYQHYANPEAFTKPFMLPLDRRPSKAYIDVIIQGIDCFNIPLYYKNFIKSFLTK